MFNFLCEVSQEQRLSYATFLHAMHIFDFALSRMPIGRNDFLMAGCASLMLAAKLEEIYVSYFKQITFYHSFFVTKNF